jgi:hypothetical protein
LRTRRLLPIFSFLAAAGLILALTIAPDQVQNSFAVIQSTKGPVQTLRSRTSRESPSFATPTR